MVFFFGSLLSFHLVDEVSPLKKPLGSLGIVRYSDINCLVISLKTLKKLNCCSDSSDDNDTIDAVDDINLIADSDFNLTFLNLSWSDINDLTQINIHNISTITSIDLSGNEFNAIESLYSDKITEISIKHGQLRRLNGLTNITSLQKAILSYNRHLTIFKVIHVNLQYVDVSHCGITELCLEYLPSLTCFYATHNRLIHISEGIFSRNLKIEQLDLSYNEIEYLEDYSFIRNKRLTHLNLSGNKIFTIDWTLPLKGVQYLNISRNLIESIDLLMLLSVITLDISQNEIENLPENLERLLPCLQTLQAKSNSIHYINKLKSSKLEYLNLRDCKIRDISPEAFMAMQKLKFLDLSDNKLQRLDFVEHLQNNSNVLLDGNLWVCQCNLTTRLDVICSPSGLVLSEFCEVMANSTALEYKPWFLHVGNPIFWAPPIVALFLVVVSFFGVRAYRRAKARAHIEVGTPSTVKDIVFDVEEIKKLLTDRLARRRLSLEFSSNDRFVGLESKFRTMPRSKRCGTP